MFECRKVNRFKSDLSVEQCNRFSELLNMNCPLDKAINFVSKTHCRYDQTKLMDGPSGFTKLPVNRNPSKSCNLSGWLVQEQSIGSLKRTIDKPNPDLAMFQNFVKRQTSDIRIRTQALEKRRDDTSKFYKHLQQNYSFNRMTKNVLLDRLKKLNETKPAYERSEVKFSRVNVMKEADEIYKNPTKTKKKFKMIADYQRTFHALQKQNYMLDFSADHNREVLELIKKDKSAIKEFNNANYKFPIHSTANDNVLEANIYSVHKRSISVHAISTRKDSLKSKLQIQI